MQIIATTRCMCVVEEVLRGLLMEAIHFLSPLTQTNSWVSHIFCQQSALSLLLHLNAIAVYAAVAASWCIHTMRVAFAEVDVISNIHLSFSSLLQNLSSIFSIVVRPEVEKIVGCNTIISETFKDAACQNGFVAREPRLCC